mmetsp:Transcript_53992/g.167338  ORF Transcript_53992/g.167338 Transcript_53992/m.167338 type:complete len:255 (-) Transcript_53992:890-1654(-)
MKTRPMDNRFRRTNFRCSFSNILLGDQVATKPVKRPRMNSLHRFLCHLIPFPSSVRPAMRSPKSVIFRAQKERANAKMFSSAKSMDTSGEASWKVATSSRCCALTASTSWRMSCASSWLICPSWQAARIASISSSDISFSASKDGLIFLQYAMWLPLKSSWRTHPRTQFIMSLMSDVLTSYSAKSRRVAPQRPWSMVSHQAPSAFAFAWLKPAVRPAICVSISKRFAVRILPHTYSSEFSQILMTDMVTARESS